MSLFVISVYPVLLFKMVHKSKDLFLSFPVFVINFSIIGSQVQSVLTTFCSLMFKTFKILRIRPIYVLVGVGHVRSSW